MTDREFELATLQYKSLLDEQLALHRLFWQTFAILAAGVALLAREVSGSTALWAGALALYVLGSIYVNALRGIPRITRLELLLSTPERTSLVSFFDSRFLALVGVAVGTIVWLLVSPLVTINW